MTNEEFQKLCKVSMCDPIVETNVEDVLKNAPIFNGGPNEKFIIEFGGTDVTIKVSVGDHINIDDTIAIINLFPVTSKVAGTITEVSERYIIGKYDIEDYSSYIGQSEEDMRARFESLLNQT